MRWKTKISTLSASLTILVTGVLFQQIIQPKSRLVRSQELYEAVNGTMKAVRSADFESAYMRVANSSRQKYSVAQFRQLFQTHYHELLDASSFEFGKMELKGSAAMVELFAVGDRGEVRHYRFNLVFEGNDWRVKEVIDLHTWPPGHRLKGLRA